MPHCMKQPFCLPALMLVLVFISCGKEKPAYLSLSGNAQGTTFSITYLDSLNRDFAAPVDSLLRLIDKSMSLWDSSSVISRIARNEADVMPDEHFIKVFIRAQEVSLATNGAFDITVGPLVKAWGFSYKKGLPPPDSMQVDSLLRLIGFQKVQLEDGRLKKADPRMEIDFNAIAQGYSVDLVADYFEQQGIKNYLVEIGGELRTLGVNNKGAAWAIGIDKPVENETDARPLQTTISLSGKSLATSGSYRKFVVRDGKKYSHTIDPKTGRSISHNMLSVSVIAADCITADAYATAFMVMGAEKAMELAQSGQLEIYCIYEDESGMLKASATPGFGN